MRSISFVVAFLSLVLWPTLAEAQSAASAPRSSTHLDGFGSVGFLGTPDAGGLAFALGTRLALGRYFAVSFDVGYGLAGGNDTFQDRWWLIPSAALVIPVDDVRFELGVGVGAGEAAGLIDLPHFVDRPFNPAWSFQLVPAVRGHAIVWTALGGDMDGFVRIDVASLVLPGNDIGIREGDANRPIADTMWLGLSVGSTFRLL